MKWEGDRGPTPSVAQGLLSVALMAAVFYGVPWLIVKILGG